MGTLVNIRFSDDGYARPFDPNDKELNVKDFCVVETERGEAVGFVAGFHHRCSQHLTMGPQPKVLRRATEQEVEAWHKRRAQEREALEMCRCKVESHGLSMHVSSARIIEQDRKITFEFTADERVDFRELVKDLAAALHMRVELWQIGVRDEAKRIDGYGICGQRMCCANHLREFVPVSIRMAKDQDIQLPPTRLAGLCGRLMCCLGYEHCAYVALGKEAPEIGAVVRYGSVEGKVVGRSLLKQEAEVKDSEGSVCKVAFARLTAGNREPKAAAGCRANGGGCRAN